MSVSENIPALQHRQQIEAYIAVRPAYITYADVLTRVLTSACQPSMPEAVIQARAKTVSSFAEKVVRKWPRCQDAVNEFTDLCGARVIVQTTEQVRAVRAFIEATFDIVERDDKTTLLGPDKFGYRDMHYIVRLDPVRTASFGVEPGELAAIAGKCAELQVRTWLQHAWADTLHDRLCKNPLHPSEEARRTAALLAGLMEEGDRNFTNLVGHLDGLIANYTAFATREQAAREIDVQQLIFDNEPAPEKVPALALRLARLVAASGDPGRAVSLLRPHLSIRGAARASLLLELGHCLCLLNRERPDSAEYREGIRHIEEAVSLRESTDLPYVPNLRSQASQRARAVSQLGWALQPVRTREHEARDCARRAHKHEPSNPYYLAAMLGLEMRFSGAAALPACMATTIEEALRACLSHAEAGIELPYAWFTAGRHCLLLGKGYDALGYCARGIRHTLAGSHCVPPGLLEDEADWVRDIHPGDKPPADCQRVLDLLTLARSGGTALPDAQRVLILAGGAASLTPQLAAAIRPILSWACDAFAGTLYSGGTNSGVPGCIGDAAAQLAAAGKKHFRLIGYLPEKVPHGVNAHAAYDEHRAVGADFTPDQLIRNWSDIIASGVNPGDVLLLGFGGGALSAVEYRIALGLGASVAVVTGTGGAVDALLADPLWAGVPNLIPLPFDAATIRAFVIPQSGTVPASALDAMAQAIHRQYLADSKRQMPPNLREWAELDETYRRANREQALYAVAILRAVGFEVYPVEGKPVLLNMEGFGAEVEKMAELEHGRWNLERIRDGWRQGPRDNSKKLHNCLVAWAELPETIRDYDRSAVRNFPAMLANAGLEVKPPSR